MEGARVVRAARGNQITTLGWPQEAPLRMLSNNLDPEVAERPEDLVVYGGTGRATRDWRSFDALVRTLTTLKADETMLVQSGRPIGVLETHEWAPRVSPSVRHSVKPVDLDFFKFVGQILARPE